MDRLKFERSPIGELVRIRGVDGRFGLEYDHVAYVHHDLSDEAVVSQESWHAIIGASRALAALNQASRQIPTPELLRRPALRREAQSTSALEGTFAPLEEVLAVDADERTRSQELLEVLNYVEAADMAFDALATRPVLTVGLLEEIHGILVQGTRADNHDAGRIRTGQVAIGSASGAIEDARFVPMPPGVQLKESLRSLLDWMAPTAGREPILAAAMAHYQFETLHPFNDGNGRIGRLLIVLQFMSSDLLSEPLLSVSPWFEARRDEYQEHLAAVTATGDWDPWVRFFARGIESSALDVAARVDRLLAVEHAYVEIAQQHRVTGLAREIVNVLIGRPILTPSMVRTTFDRTPQASANALRKLVDVGILDGPYGNYNMQFAAHDVWVALTAPVGRVPLADAPLVGNSLTPLS